jgi:hypothetical protein
LTVSNAAASGGDAMRHLVCTSILGSSNDSGTGDREMEIRFSAAYSTAAFAAIEKARLTRALD